MKKITALLVLCLFALWVVIRLHEWQKDVFYQCTMRMSE